MSSKKGIRNREHTSKLRNPIKMLNWKLSMHAKTLKRERKINNKIKLETITKALTGDCKTGTLQR